MPDNGETERLREAVFDARPDLDGYTAREAYEAGVVAALALFTRVGPISEVEWVSRTTYDEPLWGLSERAYRLTAEFGRTAEQIGEPDA